MDRDWRKGGALSQVSAVKSTPFVISPSADQIRQAVKSVPESVAGQLYDDIVKIIGAPTLQKSKKARKITENDKKWLNKIWSTSVVDALMNDSPIQASVNNFNFIEYTRIELYWISHTELDRDTVLNAKPPDRVKPFVLPSNTKNRNDLKKALETITTDRLTTELASLGRLSDSLIDAIGNPYLQHWLFFSFVDSRGVKIAYQLLEQFPENNNAQLENWNKMQQTPMDELRNINTPDAELYRFKASQVHPWLEEAETIRYRVRVAVFQLHAKRLSFYARMYAPKTSKLTKPPSFPSTSSPTHQSLGDSNVKWGDILRNMLYLEFVFTSGHWTRILNQVKDAIAVGSWENAMDYDLLIPYIIQDEDEYSLVLLKRIKRYIQRLQETGLQYIGSDNYKRREAVLYYQTQIQTLTSFVDQDNESTLKKFRKSAPTSFISKAEIEGIIYRRGMYVPIRFCICGSIAPNVCGACYSVSYCSEECGKKDWYENRHNEKCGNE